jgi:hypothetical protein
MEINPQIRPATGLACRANYMENPINGSSLLGIVLKFSWFVHVERNLS